MILQNTLRSKLNSFFTEIIILLGLSIAVVHKDSGTPRRIALVVVSLITIAFDLIGNPKVIANINKVCVVFLNIN